ncbi:c-type cytochrome [Devosia sp.]|uniref:c-type cytochrome n=1 Tax=Devosia sp. TaxID=1871048 RepID=UPI003A94E235
MPISRFVLTGLAALALSGVTAISVAQDVTITPDPALESLSVDEMVEKRQQIMKTSGGLLRSAGGLSGDDAVAAAETLIEGFSNLTVLFPEGSNTSDSRALPAIWEDWDTFESLLAQGVMTSEEMKTAAADGDSEAYMAAIKAVGGLCGQCHQQFRSK